MLCRLHISVRWVHHIIAVQPFHIQLINTVYKLCLDCVILQHMYLKLCLG